MIYAIAGIVVFVTVLVLLALLASPDVPSDRRLGISFTGLYNPCFYIEEKQDGRFFVWATSSRTSPQVFGPVISLEVAEQARSQLIEEYNKEMAYQESLKKKEETVRRYHYEERPVSRSGKCL